MCIVCVLGFTTILRNPFFFFFGEGEKEEKNNFQHVHVSTMMYTLSSFSSFMCKKTIFPHIIANSFCYFRAGL